MRKLEPKKGNLLIYLGLLIFAVAGLFVARQSTTRHIVKRPTPLAVELDDTIRVGMQISPIGVSTAADTIGGFYYDMIRQIAADNNLTLEISGFTQIADALEMLQANEYDIVISDIPVTTELRENFLFTDPVYSDRQVLVQRTDSTGSPIISTQRQLRGATVHVASESPFIGRIRNLSHEIGDTIYVVQDEDYGPEQLIMMTALGEIPNVVVNVTTAKSMLTKYPELDASLEISFNQFQSWVVAPRDSILRDSLNVYIQRFKLTDDYNSLINKYFQ